MKPGQVAGNRTMKVSFDLSTYGTLPQAGQTITKLISELKLQGFHAENFEINGMKLDVFEQMIGGQT